MPQVPMVFCQPANCKRLLSLDRQRDYWSHRLLMAARHCARPYVVLGLLTGFAVAESDIELRMPLEVSATAFALALRPLTTAFASARKPPVVIACAIAVATPRVPLAEFVE